MADPYISQITAFGCNYAIQNWALCQGALLPVVQYQAVFALLGTSFGGNGTSNFGLPDLRGRAPIGWGQRPGGYPYNLGDWGGYDEVQISRANLPQQSLSVISSGTTTPSVSYVQASSSGPDTDDPDGAFQATFPPGNPVYSSTLTSPKPFGAVEIPAAGVTSTGSTEPMGVGSGLENRSPYQAVNWQICLDGAWPPRQ
ncbi:MAG: tail fiber protein [Alphaproteobacteria bacterium]|nr:tail fiber protein [Alphaproteobacteria bacterium]